MGENHFAAIPVAVYGLSLLMNAVAYTILVNLLVRHEGPTSMLAEAMGMDRKGKISLVLYAAGIASAFFLPALALFFYVAVALIWFVPDRRIERVMKIS